MVNDLEGLSHCEVLISTLCFIIRPTLLTAPPASMQSKDSVDARTGTTAMEISPDTLTDKHQSDLLAQGRLCVLQAVKQQLRGASVGPPCDSLSVRLLSSSSECRSLLEAPQN